MQQTDQNNKLLEEAKKRMNESRKKVIRFNTLLSLFFCFIIVGLAGAIYYYKKINNLYEEKEVLNIRLTKAAHKDSLNSDSIQKQNIKLGEFAKLLEVCATKTKIPGFDSATAISLKAEVTDIKKRDSARKYSEIGYTKLKAYDFISAKNAFDKSEKFYNGYRESYEIYYLLYKNMNNLADPETQKKIMQKILTDYNSKNILKGSDIR